MPPCCYLAQTRETQRSSTGIDSPALSSAAVLSLCRNFTFPFCLNIAALRSISLPCTAETQEPRWPSTGGNLPARSAAAVLHHFRLSISFLPQHRCLAQTQETHRSSPGIKTPALSAAAALSLCQHITISFLPCFASADVHIPLLPQQCCPAQTQEPHRSSTGTNIPALSAADVRSLCCHCTFHFCEQIAFNAKALLKTKALRRRRR